MLSDQRTSAKKRLIWATRILLHERGYEATSPRAILKLSGAGQGSLYHHFEGKRDLAIAVLREVEAEKTARAADVLRSELAPLARVEAYFRLERDALKGCPLGRHTSEGIMEDEALREPVTNHFNFVKCELARAVREAQQVGDLRGDLDSEELATTLFATLQGSYVLARAFQDAEALDHALSGALALLQVARAQSMP